MNALLRITLFSLLVIGFFTAYSNFGVPQIAPAPPPAAESMNLAGLDTDTLIIKGKQLYFGKGACDLCHNPTTGRAPLLDNLGANLPLRIGADSYQGQAENLEQYNYESMLNPSVFIVPGFGNPAQPELSPMPSVKAAGINLSDAEIRAILIYLQDLNNLDADINLATMTETYTPPAPSAVLADPVVDELISRLGCGVCHSIGLFTGTIGPDLTQIGSLRDKQFLRRAIVDPMAEITQGYQPVMLPVYGDQLEAHELDLLVNYLSELK